MGTAISCFSPSSALEGAEVYSTQDLFLDPVSNGGFSELYSSERARKCFSNYIKSGVWVDALESFESVLHKSDDTTVENDEDAGVEHWTAAGYQSACNIEKRTRTQSSESIYSTRSNCENSADSPSRKKRDLLYADVDDVCFSIEELSIILIVALYPFYRRSRFYLHYLQNQGRTDEDYEEYLGSEIGQLSRAPSEADLNKPRKSNRLRSILISVAAFHDLDHFVEILQGPDIISSYIDILNSCAYAVTVSAVKSVPGSSAGVRVGRGVGGPASPKVLPQTPSDGSGSSIYPIVYANTAFSRLTGHKYKATASAEDSLELSKFLLGPQKQPVDHKQLIDSLRTAKPLKMGLQCSKKNGSGFVNMAAVRPLGGVMSHLPQQGPQAYTYVLCLHFEASPSRPAKVRQLQEMADLLELFPLLLRCPEADPITAPVKHSVAVRPALKRASSISKLLSPLNRQLSLQFPQQYPSSPAQRVGPGGMGRRQVSCHSSGMGCTPTNSSLTSKPPPPSQSSQQQHALVTAFGSAGGTSSQTQGEPRRPPSTASTFSRFFAMSPVSSPAARIAAAAAATCGGGGTKGAWAGSPAGGLDMGGPEARSASDNITAYSSPDYSPTWKVSIRSCGHRPSVSSENTELVE